MFMLQMGNNVSLYGRHIRITEIFGLLCGNRLSISLSYYIDVLFNDVLIIFRARCSYLVRAFAHGAMGRWIDPSRWTH